MATTIAMPQMGYDMKVGTVVKWRKREGDPVTRGEIIAEIETDKAVVEMEAYASGVLRKVLVGEGKTVPVGELIAVITLPDEGMPDLAGLKVAQAPAAKAQTAAPPEPAAKATTAMPVASTTEEVRASPIARRLARERGIDLARVKGSGPGGRITEADVEGYKERAPAPAAAPAVGGRVELSRMRQTIARRTAQSKREAPHFYVTVEIDMTRAQEMRKEINDTLPEGTRVSINDLLIKACAKALAKFPNFNASFQENYLQMNSTVNMGIAVALPQGLMVPSIPNCQDKSLVDIARASRDLIDRTHKGHLRTEEYAGSTFSISNLGMFDVDSFAAIIFPPHAAVVAVGSVKEQPVARDGQIKVAQMMKATISVDHRVADGAEAAQFLQEVKRVLEHPSLLLV